MKRRFAALAVAWLSLAGCAQEATPPAAQAAAIPPCADSEEGGCENGKPLCMLDVAGACQACRCTTYPPLASDRAFASELSHVPLPLH